MIRKEPELYRLEWLLEHLAGKRGGFVMKQIGGRWMPARPIGFQGTMWRRFKIAWEVFTGRADAVTWPGGQ